MIAAMSAILNFNSGAEKCLEVMTDLGIPSGQAVQYKLNMKTRKRVAKAQRKSTEKAKHHRQVVQEAKSKEEERIKEREGVTYSSGHFDDDIQPVSQQLRRGRKRKK